MLSAIAFQSNKFLSNIFHISSCVSSLLQWATRILHKEISADGNEHRCHSAPYLDCIASVVSELDGSENINLSFVENLTE